MTDVDAKPAKRSRPHKRTQNVQIVGIRMPPERARAFKAEAARRGIPINQLFAELWQTYQQNQPQRTG
jgi:LDH2 family malate/lactate/ureidoglycolate dehydrogenase